MTSLARRYRCALVILASLTLSPLAWGDVFRPAYLEIRELGDDRYDVLLKVPSQGEEMRLSLDVRFPEGTVEVEPRRAQFVADGHTSRWRIERRGGLIHPSTGICLSQKA
jgi:hypothetical protein